MYIVLTDCINVLSYMAVFVLSSQLQKHDRDMSSKSPGLRSAEEMAKEAAMMRSAVKESL